MQTQVIRAGRSEIALLRALFEQIEMESQPANTKAREMAATGFDNSLARFDFLASDSFWILVGLIGGQPVGYATLVRMPKADARVAALYLDELHVLKTHRRRGVASALLDEVTVIAKEVGAWRIRLLVSPHNQAARNLYRSLGFSEVEEILCEKTPEEDV